MKKTRVWPALLAALVILAGCAAAPPEESDPPTEEFVFTRENMPRLNGSTSAVPLAEAVCSVLLGESREEVADLVQFSRTTASYEALMAGEADLLLAGEPEQAVMERLEAGDRWLLTPFATDALVFVVNADNPVNGLTTEQLQKIYTGEITNWSQVGGEDRDIIPFQRNPEAGSQALMKKLVMDGLEMMEPPVDYTAGSMSSLLEGVRQYDNSPAAIGYTVYYYAHDMEMAQGLKLLSIDGTAPSPDTIRSGEYPFLNPYYAVMDKDEAEDSPARILYDWLLGEEGQSLVAQEGYVSILEQEGEYERARRGLGPGPGAAGGVRPRPGGGTPGGAGGPGADPLGGSGDPGGVPPRRGDSVAGRDRGGSDPRGGLRPPLPLCGDSHQCGRVGGGSLSL